MMEQAVIKTPLGSTKIVGDKNGITSITVLDEETTISTNIPDDLKEATQQLQAYFTGNLVHFNFKINPQGTDFQKRVWKELLNIPFGKTTSYLELSKTLGDVKAIRAVASANGKNPLWISRNCVCICKGYLRTFVNPSFLEKKVVFQCSRDSIFSHFFSLKTECSSFF